MKFLFPSLLILVLCTSFINADISGVKGPKMDAVTTSYATLRDVNAILEFMYTDFLQNESLNGAVKMTKKDARELFLFLIRKGVASGTSLLLKNSKGAIVGLRLSSYVDKSKEGQVDKDEENLKLSSKAEKIVGLLDELDKGRFNLMPKGTKKVFYIIVTSVHADYTRRGLGRQLMEYGLDKAKKAGATGILSEATAMMSQGLFYKLGYVVLKEIKHADYKDKEGNRIFTCPDGTNKAQLVFKAL